MAGRLKLGQILVAQGLIHPDQLAAALGAQAQQPGRLGMALVEMGAIEEEQLIRVLAEQLGVRVARIGDKTVGAEILELVSSDVAEKHRCLPLFLREEGDGDVLVLAMEDPSDAQGLAEVQAHVRCRLRPVLIGPTELEACFERYFRRPPREADETAPDCGEIAALPPLSPGPLGAPQGGALPLLSANDPMAPLPELEVAEDPFEIPAPEGLGLDFDPHDETLEPLDEDFPDAVAAPQQDSASDADSDSAQRFESLSFGDPDASWSEPAEDPSLAGDPFAGEDPFAEFDKEPFAGDSGAHVDDAPTDPVRSELAPRREASPSRQDAIVQALAQLLVEKGVITREEFAQRLRKLSSG